MATQVGDLGPFSGSFSGTDSNSANVTDPFSMTQVIAINHSRSGNTDLTTGDANLRVPAPATLGLLGIGLIGMGLIGRRKLAQG
jgi:hypothetical protein